MRTIRTGIGALSACVFLAAFSSPGPGQERKPQPVEKAGPYVFVPPTVSPEFQEYLKTLPDPIHRPTAPAPDDLEAWKLYHQNRERDLEPKVQRALKQYEPTVTERKLGGVPVLDIKPKGRA